MTTPIGDTASTFEVIRPYDPAVADTPVEEIRHYIHDRDPARLRVREGMAPVRFVCRPLTRSQRRRVQGLGSEYLARDLAFRLGVVALKDWPADDGTTTTILVQRAEGSDSLTDEELDRLLGPAGDDDIQDVGSVILRRSTLGKGVPPVFPLLDTSLDSAIHVRAVLSVERARRQASESDEDSGPAEAPGSATPAP
jgi:hypothetical protein